MKFVKLTQMTLGPRNEETNKNTWKPLGPVLVNLARVNYVDAESEGAYTTITFMDSDENTSCYVRVKESLEEIERMVRM